MLNQICTGLRGILLSGCRYKNSLVGVDGSCFGLYIYLTESNGMNWHDNSAAIEILTRAICGDITCATEFGNYITPVARY